MAAICSCEFHLKVRATPGDHTIPKLTVAIPAYLQVAQPFSNASCCRHASLYLYIHR